MGSFGLSDVLEDAAGVRFAKGVINIQGEFFLLSHVSE